MGLTPIRVGQLNNYVDRLLKSDPLLSNIAVIGEISNLNFHQWGNVYFSLKDDAAVVRCFLPGRNASRITAPLEEGMEVTVYGFLNVYARGGYYSLNVQDVQVSGTGQLAVRFEQLKQKLASEGLFDPEHKKPLPSFPETVAVVTSPTGAAVQDIQKIIRGKNDMVNILLCPVLVQGPSAAPDIAGTIDRLNREHPEVDVIIAGRGGGSMEDLWAFNEEIVARSIFRSRIPVISAVGHETDFTIADFVADVRAETPTAAADYAVPDTRELRRQIQQMKEDMDTALLRRTQLAQQRLQAVDPSAFAAGIQTRIDYERMYLDQLADGMQLHLQEKIREGEHRIQLLRQLLDAANPYDILRRGYSVVSDASGRVLRSVDDLKDFAEIQIRMSDGIAHAQVTDYRKENDI